MLFVIILILLFLGITLIKTYDIPVIFLLRILLLVVGWSNLLICITFAYWTADTPRFRDLPDEVRDVAIPMIKFLSPYLAIIFLLSGVITLLKANHVKVTIELKKSIEPPKTN